MFKHSVAAACAVLGLAACQPSAPALPVGEITELTLVDLEIGDGTEAAPGMVAVVHYTGWLYDAAAPDRRGEEFDSSRGRGQPYAFPLGAGRVIAGWDKGVAGMRVGGRRLLYIPSAEAYGERGRGPIPPGAALVFDVELREVRGDGQGS